MRDRQRFVRLVADATAGLDGEIRSAVDAAAIVVADVPLMGGPAPEGNDVVDLTSVERGTDPADDPPFASYDRDRKRLVVYRRPLEVRATGRADLVLFIRAAIAREVAEALGLDDGWDDRA